MKRHSASSPELTVELIKSLPNTLEGLISAHNDDKVIEFLGKVGVIDVQEANQRIDAGAIGVVALGAVLPQEISISVELEDPSHASKVKEVSARQHPDWRRSSSSISSEIRIMELEEKERAETGEVSTIRIPSRSFTGALMDFPTRLSVSKEPGANELVVRVAGLDYDGEESTAILSRDLNVAYYAGG